MAQIWTPVALLPQQDIGQSSGWLARFRRLFDFLHRAPAAAEAPCDQTPNQKPLQIFIEDEDKLRVAGRLTATTVSSLIETIACLSTHPRTMTVDFGEVHCIDTAAVGAIVLMARRFSLSGGRLRITGMTKETRRVIDLCDPRLATLLEQGRIKGDRSFTASYATVEEAG